MGLAVDGAFARPFLQAGLALLANGSWAVVLVPATTAVIRVRVIEREERYLERAFGEECLRYKAGVAAGSEASAEMTSSA